MKEKKDRVEDALSATRAAVEEGIIPGGGVAFVRAIESLENVKAETEEEKLGINIVKRAIEEPLRQIVENAGGEGSVVVQKCKSRNRRREIGNKYRKKSYRRAIASDCRKCWW